MNFLSDTHCHLYLDEFQDDLDAVVERAVQTGVKKILVLGIDLASNKDAIALSEKYTGLIFPAVGIHPNYTGKAGKDDIEQIRSLIRNTPAVRAIGEIGLDFYRTWSSHEDQYFFFKEMLSLAEEFGLPVCLHMRDSAAETLEVLEPWYQSLVNNCHPLIDHPGIFHSFDGNPEVAQWAIEHHFMLGIGGTVTYKKAQSLRDILVDLGLDHLVLETDAPFLTPHPHRGKRNEPAYVQYTAEKLSEILSLPVEKVQEVTGQNAQKLFRWDHV